MSEIIPNTTFSNRQRFEFLCPEHRTAEARGILGLLNVRLAPPNSDAVVETRIHLFAGTSYGIKIKGVAVSQDAVVDVLKALGDAEIAGYSRRTQVLLPDNIHRK